MALNAKRAEDWPASAGSNGSDFNLQQTFAWRPLSFASPIPDASPRAKGVAVTSGQDSSASTRTPPSANWK